MLTTIARYSFPYEAHIAKSRLDSEGVPSFLADEYTITMQWLYSDALGGVRLQVPEAYADAARAILAEERETELVEQYGIVTSTCPHCGSRATEFHQIGRRWAFLAFLAFGFPLFPVSDGIKCRQCGSVSRT